MSEERVKQEPRHVLRINRSYTEIGEAWVRIPEPDRPAVDWEADEANARRRVFSVLRAKEIAVQEDQSITNALRRVRVEARRQGKDIERHMATIRREIDEARKQLGI